MKIATNVSRDRFGGITTSNVVLFDAMDAKRDAVVGMEFAVRRSFPGATVFWKYQPNFFRHYVITCLDLAEPNLVNEGESLGGFAKRWKPAIEAASDILKHEAPDVVLANGTFFAPWLLSRAARHLKLPIVLRYAGVLSRETEHYPAGVRKVFRAMERDIARSARHIIFPSDLCRRVVEKDIVRGTLPEWSVVHNPVRSPSTPPVARTRTLNDIAVIGRWTPVKNFGAFFDLHAALKRDKWPHRAFIITTHGAPRAIPRSIIRIPPMDHDQLWRFYASLGLLVMPSHFETFGNVAAEAVMSGVPVLVSDNTGFAEVLQAVGLDRMVVDFSDQKTAIARIKELCGTVVSETALAALRKMLDPVINRDRILAVMREEAKEELAE